MHILSFPSRKNHKIKVIDMVTREVSDFSGSGDQAINDLVTSPDGPRQTCRFNFPMAMALDKRLQRLMVSDLLGLREVDLQTGATRTIVRWKEHYHALTQLEHSVSRQAQMNDFADGPLEIASMGSRASVPGRELDVDRRAPIVQMQFSADGRQLFFVNVVRDFIRSMYVAGPTGVDIRDCAFRENMAPHGAGLDVLDAQSLVQVSGSRFIGRSALRVRFMHANQCTWMHSTREKRLYEHE